MQPNSRGPAGSDNLLALHPFYLSFRASGGASGGAMTEVCLQKYLHHEQILQSVASTPTSPARQRTIHPTPNPNNKF